MNRCTECGGYNPGNRRICPDCIRAAEIIDNQNAAAYENAQRVIEEQERIAFDSQKTAYLNGIKSKLLDVAILAANDYEKAFKSASIILKSSDVKENMSYFWPVISENTYLKDIYYHIYLKPLEEDWFDDDDDCLIIVWNDALNEMDSRARESVALWLSRQPSDSKWKSEIFPKYSKYTKLIKDRELLKAKQDARLARRIAERSANSNPTQGTKVKGKPTSSTKLDKKPTSATSVQWSLSKAIILICFLGPVGLLHISLIGFSAMLIIFLSGIICFHQTILGAFLLWVGPSLVYVLIKGRNKQKNQ